MPKLAAFVLLVSALIAAHAQVLIDGRVTIPRWPGATETIPLPTVRSTPLLAARNRRLRDNARLCVCGTWDPMACVLASQNSRLEMGTIPAMHRGVYSPLRSLTAKFRLCPATPTPSSLRASRAKKPKDNFARMLGPKHVDGGWSQRVSGLSRFETYHLTGSVRASYPLTFEHRADVGYDPTGQDNDPKAPTIVWAAFPQRHGVWESFASAPIRPGTNSISVWLRARSTGTEFPFKADFDDVSLRRVRTAPAE